MGIDDIIDWIYYLRNRANLSARKLSLAIGKNAGYIHLLENKKNFEPSLSTLLKIIEICGSSPEEFFYGSFESYKTDKRALEFFKPLSERQKEAIMNLYN